MTGNGGKKDLNRRAVNGFKQRLRNVIEHNTAGTSDDYLKSSFLITLSSTRYVNAIIRYYPYLGLQAKVPCSGKKQGIIL